MKKAIAMLMVLVMMLALSATSFAAGGKLTLDEAKQAALDYAGVKASEANFTKAHKDYDDGRQVYEIEFYADNTEYDMDVDVNTGRITDFNMEYHGGYGRYDDDFGYYDDDWYDWDDRFDYYDRDWDDMFDIFD